MNVTDVPRLSYSIINHGKIIRLEGHGIFHACSMSKLVATMAVLKLVSLGKLDLDEDINSRLRSWKLENRFEKEVTLRLLLSHQGGLVDAEGSFGILNPGDGYPQITDILQGKTSYHSRPVEVKFCPGREFEYSDAGFCIIEQLLVDVMDKPFPELMDELVLTPLAMENSFFAYPHQIENKSALAWGHDKDGAVAEGKWTVYPYLAAAGLWTTPEDMCKLTIEVFQGLEGKSKLGLSTELVQDMISPQGGFEFAGLGVLVTKTCEGTQITSQGWGVGYQCMLSAIPQSGQGAVVMINSEPGMPQHKSLVGETLRQICSTYNWPIKIEFYS